MPVLWVINTARISGFRTSDELWQLLCMLRRNSVQNPMGILEYNGFIDLEFVAMKVSRLGDQYWLSGRFLTNRDVAIAHAQTMEPQFFHLSMEYTVADPQLAKVMVYRFLGRGLTERLVLPASNTTGHPHDAEPPVPGEQSFSLSLGALKEMDHPGFLEQLKRLKPANPGKGKAPSPV
jgi:hypothetical protein